MKKTPKTDQLIEAQQALGTALKHLRETRRQRDEAHKLIRRLGTPKAFMDLEGVRIICADYMARWREGEAAIPNVQTVEERLLTMCNYHHEITKDDKDFLAILSEKVEGITSCSRPLLRAADIVRHDPSGEDWVLAVDEENGRVQPCRWPPTIADAKDCTLSTPATDEQRLVMLADWTDEHERDLRTHTARRQISSANTKVSRAAQDSQSTPKP